MAADYTRFMPVCQDSLPDEVALLKAMLAERSLQMEQQTRIVLDLRHQLETKASEIEALKLLIAKLRRMQFGRRSEKLDRQIEQLELQLDALLIAQGPVAPAPPSDSGNIRQPTRKPLPPHLPRIEQVSPPMRIPALIAAARSSRWERMWPSSWNMCRRAFASSATNVPSWHVPAVTR